MEHEEIKINAYTCDIRANECYCIGPEYCKDKRCPIVKAWVKDQEAVCNERKI